MAKETVRKSDTRPAAPRGGRRQPDIKALYEPRNLWAILIFVVATLIFFSGHLFGGHFLWEDFAEFTYPNEVFAARNFAAGILPQWNPFTFNGMPFLADLQIGFFYPGNLLMYLFSGGHLSAWLTQFFVIIHYFIAMLGMWKLAKGYGVGQWGAIFAGITYAFSGILVAHMIHPNMLFHLAWFPLVLYFFHRGVVERSWFHSILAGIILGLSFLSGHPQSLLYIVFFLFCYSIFLLVRSFRDDNIAKSSVMLSAVAAAVPIVIAVAIFAIQLLPAQELAGLSERATMTYEKTLEGAMTPGQLLTLVVPKLFGVAAAEPRPEIAFWLRQEPFYFWETAIYIGVAGLLLAIVGLASRKMEGLGWFFGGMALLGILYGLGESFIVHPLLSKLPLFGTFRSPVRLAIYFSLGGALLAGVGLERILRADNRAEALSKTVLVAGGAIVFLGILCVAGVLGGLVSVPKELADGIASTGIPTILIAGLTTGIAWVTLKRKFAPTGAAVALIALGVIDLFIFGISQNASLTNPQSTYDANDAQFAAFKASPPDKIFRVKMRERGAMLMQRNQGPYSGIMLFEGYNPLLLERRVPPAATPEKAYDFMDITYGVALDSTTGQMGVAERPTAFPHARMMYDARIGNTDQVRAWLKDQGIDFGKTVLLEEKPSVAPDPAGTGTARITKYDASEISVSVNGDKPGILLLSEVWYPAWKVYTDGNPQPLLKADYSLRGIAVPAGQHTVTLRYESDAFKTGMMISIIGLIGSLGALAFFGFRRRKVRMEQEAKKQQADGVQTTPAMN